MIGDQKLLSSMRELTLYILNAFKDTYVFEFLNLSEIHSEGELQVALIAQMKNVILELRKDFCLWINNIEYKLITMIFTST